MTFTCSSITVPYILLVQLISLNFELAINANHGKNLFIFFYPAYYSSTILTRNSVLYNISILDLFFSKSSSLLYSISRISPKLEREERKMKCDLGYGPN